MWASASDHTDTVRALLSAGAQADLQDEVSKVSVSYHSLGRCALGNIYPHVQLISAT